MYVFKFTCYVIQTNTDILPIKCGNALVEVLATVIFIFYGKQKQIIFA